VVSTVAPTPFAAMSLRMSCATMSRLGSLTSVKANRVSLSSGTVRRSRQMPRVNPTLPAPMTATLMAMA
jgi:hypothetical protein